ncbi:MAG TPA: GNAT family N-acetyltransferase [Actinomycetota bacterium]
MIEVREAAAEDWPAVAALLADLGRPDVLGGPDEDAARRVYLGYLERPDAVALVAVDGERVVGFVDMEYRVRLNFLTPQAWIPDLIVSQESRSRGAGAALLARCEELAREHGCWSLSLESANWRERAHAFYLREGLADNAKSFSKLFEGSGVQWPPAPPGHGRSARLASPRSGR